jgi:hypothetical protein
VSTTYLFLWLTYPSFSFHSIFILFGFILTCASVPPIVADALVAVLNACTKEYWRNWTMTRCSLVTHTSPVIEMSMEKEQIVKNKVMSVGMAGKVRFC